MKNRKERIAKLATEVEDQSKNIISNSKFSKINTTSAKYAKNTSQNIVTTEPKEKIKREDVEDDDGYVNQSLEYRIASGGIPIGSGGLYFKLNPSYLDALNWLCANPNDILSKIAPPIRLGAKYFMEQVN